MLRARDAMPSYTLWVLAEADGAQALLFAEHADGSFGAGALVGAAEDVARFVRDHGMPQGITASDWGAVKQVREGEPRLFHVPATVLKPKDLAAPVLAALLRAYRR